MSFEISPPPPVVASNDEDKDLSTTNSTKLTIEGEWVEIIEPKSKTKIYANLESGMCAKSPPEGVTILKANDFDDQWWELYDKKTGKYYYYNPEQQKTVWTKPVANGATATNGSSNGRPTNRGNLLIIPVSKLQTFKKLAINSEQSSYKQVSKCDASTQTIASNLVTTGTQTFSENELCEKLNEIDIQQHQLSGRQSSSPKAFNSNQTTNRISSKIAEYQTVFNFKQGPTATNHRQSTDFSGKYRPPLLKSTTINNVSNNTKTNTFNRPNGAVISQSFDKPDDQQNKSSQNDSVDKKHLTSSDGVESKNAPSARAEIVKNYFSPQPQNPPPPVLCQKEDQLQAMQQQHYRRSMHLRDNTKLASSSAIRPDDALQNTTYTPPSTSTFKNLSSSKQPISSTQIVCQPSEVMNEPQHSPSSENKRSKINASKHQQQPQQQVVTNNLSHYLVREARAMGIALISDDELDDDDQDSDEDLANDDDEDTDLRDDLSSNRDLANDFKVSQDFSEDSSEGGWRSFSDQESPNAQNIIGSASSKQQKLLGSKLLRKHNLIKPPQEPKVPISPISCETTSSSFRYDNNELIDDQRNPAACMSQQLDNRKLVENFKKTRQTSALGFNDSLSRSYRLDANNAVQRLKTVADTYFNNTTGAVVTGAGCAQERGDPYKSNEKYLRHLSTLSTLPRPIKAKPPQVPPDAELVVDADYDIVEENCGYYSDSERIQAALGQSVAATAAAAAAQLDTSKISSTSKTSGHGGDTTSSPVTSYFDRNKSTRGSTFSVESFARENLTRHPKKGGLLFNRKVKWTRMISWTKNSIKQPMISSVSSELSSESIASFKLIQQFMGDRKITMSKRYRQILAQSGLSEQEISSMISRKSLARTGSLSASNTLNTSPASTTVGGGASGSSTSASAGTTSGHSSIHIPDRLRDELALELSIKGCVNSPLRDEIFVQLARQLTENPNVDSINWGLVLMSILLNYFSPSSKFAPFLLSFLETHTHQMARDVCLPRLEKRLRQNWLSYCRKPADGKEISIVRLSITKWPQYCGVFGESIERIMSLQACSPYLKTLRLPWILTILGEKLLETGGDETEGIFRCAADHDLLAQLRLEIDCVDFRKITDATQLSSLLSNVDDPHVIAGLLKLFFRQLLEPVFPSRMYDVCLLSCHDATMACRLFNERLPNLNKDVVAYLIRLLQMLSEQDKVINTKMDIANLSMVWAPNLLRAPENSIENLTNCSYDSTTSKSDSKWSISNSGGTEDYHQGGGGGTATVNSLTQPSHSQSMIFEQTRQEMQFIKLLITNLDTSFIKDVL